VALASTILNSNWEIFVIHSSSAFVCGNLYTEDTELIVIALKLKEGTAKCRLHDV